MRDSQHGGQTGRSGEDLTALARTVVARLAAQGGPVTRPVDDALLAAMTRAVIAPDPGAFAALRPDLRRARVGEVELIDRYFPAVARALGCDWAEDRAGWAEVTLGMARLQALLHQMLRPHPFVSSAGSITVLIVLPPGEQHSFGVKVLAEQLRRMGIVVHSQLAAGPDRLRQLAAERSYDCAMISAACEARVETCRKLVQALKQGSGGRLWVAVGGPVCDRIDGLERLTGADLATSDPMLAIGSARAARPAPGHDTGLAGVAPAGEKRLERT